MIRQCNDGDLEAICSIINGAAEAYKGVIPQDRWKEPYMSQKELLGEVEDGITFWGYEDSGELVGVMGIQTVQDVNDSGSGGVSASEGEQHAIETRANPAFRIDSEGKVSAWSKICEELLGFGSMQMLGRSPLSFVSKPHQADFRDAMLRAMKGESVAQKDWKYYTLQGDAVHVLAEIYPVFSISGKVQECVVVNTDVTHLKQRIKRLERYTVESKERLRELTKEYDLLKSNIANFIRKKEE